MMSALRKNSYIQEAWEIITNDNSEFSAQHMAIKSTQISFKLYIHQNNRTVGRPVLFPCSPDIAYSV